MTLSLSDANALRKILDEAVRFGALLRFKDGRSHDLSAVLEEHNFETLLGALDDTRGSLVASIYGSESEEVSHNSDVDAARRFGQALVEHHDDGGEYLGEWWDDLPFVLGLIDGIASDRIREEYREEDGPSSGHLFLNDICCTDLPNQIRNAIYNALRPFMNEPRATVDAA